MYPVTLDQLPARLARLFTTDTRFRYYATPKGRNGGRQYAVRCPEMTHVYRCRRGQWVLTRSY